MNTSFEDTIRTHVLFKKKIQDMVGTREQEESNNFSQNKESIHALKINSAFEN